MAIMARVMSTLCVIIVVVLLSLRSIFGHAVICRNMFDR